MTAPPAPAAVAKVAQLCATEQFEELRVFIPVTIPPDQSVHLSPNSRLPKFSCKDSDILVGLSFMFVLILEAPKPLVFYYVTERHLI
jgi:hypothetical protein